MSFLGGNMLRLCEPVSDIFHLRTSPVIRKQLAVENKLFNFSVGDNERGKFMRIAECSFGYVRNQLVKVWFAELRKYVAHTELLHMLLACVSVVHSVMRMLQACACVLCKQPVYVACYCTKRVLTSAGLPVDVTAL